MLNKYIRLIDVWNEVLFGSQDSLGCLYDGLCILWEDGGISYKKNGMDYHIPVFGGVAKEPPMHIVHIAVEMAPIAKVTSGWLIYCTRRLINMYHVCMNILHTYLEFPYKFSNCISAHDCFDI